MTQTKYSCAHHGGRDSWSAGLQGQTRVRWNQSPTEAINKNTGCPEKCKSKNLNSTQYSKQLETNLGRSSCGETNMKSPRPWHRVHDARLHSFSETVTQQIVYQNQHPAISLLKQQLINTIWKEIHQLWLSHFHLKPFIWILFTSFSYKGNKQNPSNQKSQGLCVSIMGVSWL